MKGIIKNQAITILIQRNPNWVSETLIREHILTVDIDAIENVIEELITEEMIERKEFTTQSLNLNEKYYKLKNSEKYPVREYIKLGDTDIPRLLIDSSPAIFPEIFNEQIEKLAAHSNWLEKRFSEKVKEEKQKYWGNVVGVLGVIVSVMSVIFVGLPKITTNPNLSFLDVVMLNLGQLLPLCIVLSLLVLLLRWIIK